MNNPSSALLDIRHLDVSYGAIKALRGVSLQVMPGELARTALAKAHC